VPGFWLRGSWLVVLLFFWRWGWDTILVSRRGELSESPIFSSWKQGYVAFFLKSENDLVKGGGMRY